MLEVAGAATSPAITREELLRRAESLIPVLRERSQESETLRCCPAESVADFIANGLLRISQPARYGELSAEAQTGVRGSTLEMYREAIRLRHELLVADEDLAWVDTGDAHVLAFRRGVIGELANWLKKPL